MQRKLKVNKGQDLEKDYLRDKGMRPTKWNHVDCDCAIYPTSDSKIGICGSCGTYFILPNQPERLSPEDATDSVCDSLNSADK